MTLVFCLRHVDSQRIAEIPQAAAHIHFCLSLKKTATTRATVMSDGKSLGSESDGTQCREPAEIDQFATPTALI